MRESLAGKFFDLI